MKIKPNYCSFKISKLLKEKGFDVECLYNYISVDGKHTNHPIRIYDYSVINWYKRETRVSCPEHWVVVEWIKTKYDIWIYTIPIPYSENLIHWRWKYKSSEYSSRAYSQEDKNDYTSSQKAYEAAFEYVLTNL